MSLTAKQLQFKKMNAIEQAHLAQKMYDQDLDQKYIAKELGVSIPQISNLRTLAALPLSMKKRIIDNNVAATLLLEVIRKNKDISVDDAIQIVEDIANKNTGKVTRKSVNKHTNTVNTVGILKKLFRQVNMNKVTKNQDIYEVLRGVFDGKFDRNSLVEFFGIK